MGMASPSRTLQLLEQAGPPALLVSLPANDLDLARAAVAGGAQGLKMHLHIRHAAAGRQFGDLAAEGPVIEQVLALGVPVGVVPGDQTAMATLEEFAGLAALGVDYCDLYRSAFPDWLAEGAPLPLMAAAGPEDMRDPARLRSLAEMPGIAMVEASIIPHEGYGQPLSPADLSDYTELVKVLAEVRRPVIVPTQRAIRPEELNALAATGIRGLLIGAIVTGTAPAGIEQATRRYRQALERLG
jgi:hypothetical protein